MVTHDGDGGQDPDQSGQLLREKSVSDPAIDRGANREKNPIDALEALGHRRRRWQQDDFLVFRPLLGGTHHLLWSAEHRWPLLSENRSQFIKHEFARRAELLRKCTELRLSGEFRGKPEYLEKYTGTPGERAKIARRRTALTLPGGVVATPEYRERFVDFPRSRPRPAKRKDCLMPLEGSVEKESEVKAKYVAHPAGRRAELQRKNTNLSLEGEMECKAEYRESFIDFPRHRPYIEKPEGQLRTNGQFQCDPEYRSSFVDFPRERPSVNKPSGLLKLNGETYFNAEYKDRFVDFPRERPRNNKPEGDLKLQEAEDAISYTAEYKERYVDFPRERPKCSRPIGDLKPEGDFEEMTSEVRSRYVWQDGTDRQPVARRQESVAASTQNGETYLIPEYRERYVTFPRERPRRRKPESQIKPPEVMVTPEETEVKAKYTGEMGRRAEMVKRDASLKLEGELIARPEYRDQYVAPPPPVQRDHAGELDHEDDQEVDVQISPKRAGNSTLRPPDAILHLSDSGGDATPPKSKSPTRVVPRPIGRRRRSVSASDVKEEIVSPYRAFRVLRSPYIGYEPTVMAKAEICRRSPSSSPGRRHREPKLTDTKRKASFVVINEDRLDDLMPTRGKMGPCAAAGSSNRGRWMPPWYTVPTVR